MSKLRDLKASRGERLQRMQDQSKKESQFGESDPRFWRPTQDKASGAGHATIRFLPSATDDAAAWSKYFYYSFKGKHTGRWYSNKSLRTLGRVDPCAEWVSVQWDGATEQEKKELPRRRTIFVSNIYIVNDPGNAENNGKVFLFRYGPQVFEKINGLLHPEFDDQKPEDPFDLWDGRNFQLRVRKKSSWNNYEKSDFDIVSELCEGDTNKLEEVIESLYALEEFVDEKSFKTYDELKQQLTEVVGESSSRQHVDETVEESTLSDDSDDILSDDDINFDDDGDDEMEQFEQMAR